jgi:hypothetical protein
MGSKPKRRKKNPDLTVSHGCMVQPRFERARYPEVKAAAARAGLSLTAWIRNLVYRELEEQKRKEI